MRSIFSYVMSITLSLTPTDNEKHDDEEQLKQVIQNV